jgi:predicted ATPase/DNA-binding NarL/FixJ family response regulator
MATAVKQSTAGNLPVELSSFVGRARELTDVKRLLSSARVITLTGPGGIGKSRLALRAAHRLGRHFPDGVWWVELAEVEGPELVAYALARSLRVHERPDAGGIDDALLSHLRGRRLLLVLDNCEHQLDACRHLVAFVASGCERVVVLCTSRERLGVAGESVVAMSGLEVPANGERLPVERLADVEALRLLVDRAVAAAPDFALMDENRRAACEICRRLDGMPLAIELAAVRLASMTADDLRERLDDRLRLLAAAHGTRPGRSRTLRATVDWSYELLSDEERILWRRLSVFAGSFGLEAAEDVCSDEGLERGRIVDLVGSLVGKSILTTAHGRRRGRYRLLETLRLYGTERLAEAGEQAEFARRHAAWYAGRFSGGERSWWGTAEQGDTFETLDVEWANVEAALDFLAGSATDAEAGLRMAADLWLYWVVRGRYRAGRRHLEVFLGMEPAPSPTRAMALWAVAFLSQATGDYAGALSASEQARLVSEQTGGDRELGYALIGLGLAHLRLGDGELAADLIERARERMVSVDDPIGLAFCFYFLATVAAGAGRVAEAQRMAKEGLEASERAGDNWSRGTLSALLGSVEVLMGDLVIAEARLKEAVRILDVVGYRWGMFNSLEGLAWLAASCGQPERAALLLGASAALRQELGIALLPPAQAHHDACEAAVRASLDEASYRSCWERGHALSWKQVVAVALEDALPADQPGRAMADGHDADELSDRELEVARLVANGLSNPMIAAELFVSTATVKTHVSHILSKLGLDSRVQLANWIAAHDPDAQTRAER